MSIGSSSNPFMKESYFENISADNQSMTVEGTISKTLILIFSAIFAASFSWKLVLDNPASMNSLVTIGGISGLCLALITAFRPNLSPYTAVPYSLAEGVALGAISAILNRIYPGIALNAVLITFSVLLIMLALFRTGVIQATERFRSVVITATIGIAFASLLSFALYFMGIGMHLYSTGTYGLLFCVFVCIIAALNLIIDFDVIIRGAESNSPKYMEWFASFGLMVTLVWLYIEILRLLSILSRKK